MLSLATILYAFGTLAASWLALVLVVTLSGGATPAPWWERIGIILSLPALLSLYLPVVLSWMWSARGWRDDLAEVNTTLRSALSVVRTGRVSDVGEQR